MYNEEKTLLNCTNVYWTAWWIHTQNKYPSKIQIVKRSNTFDNTPELKYNIFSHYLWITTKKHFFCVHLKASQWGKFSSKYIPFSAVWSTTAQNSTMEYSAVQCATMLLPVEANWAGSIETGLGNTPVQGGNCYLHGRCRIMKSLKQKYLTTLLESPLKDLNWTTFSRIFSRI